MSGATWPRLVAACFLLAALPTAAATAPTLQVEVAPGPFTVGDRVTAVLEVAGPPDSFSGPPVFPAWDQQWGEAEVLAVAVEHLPADSETPSERYRQTLELTAFRTGDIALPPVAVRVRGSDGESELTSPADLAFSVASVLTAQGDEEPELKAPEPPRPLPFGLRFWLTAALLSSLIAALLVAILVRRLLRGETAPPVRPLLAPLEELRRAVAAARQADSPRTGHATISLALRRYLGRTLDFSAVESSTTEIRRRLATRSLPAGAVRRAVAVLSGCDLVKFARRPATGDDLTDRADDALAAASEIEAQLAARAAQAAPELAGGQRGRKAAA